MPYFGHKSNFWWVKWICFRYFNFQHKLAAFVGGVGRTVDLALQLRVVVVDQFHSYGASGNLKTPLSSEVKWQVITFRPLAGLFVLNFDRIPGELASESVSSLACPEHQVSSPTHCPSSDKCTRPTECVKGSPRVSTTRTIECRFAYWVQSLWERLFSTNAVASREFMLRGDSSETVRTIFRRRRPWHLRTIFPNGRVAALFAYLFAFDNLFEFAFDSLCGDVGHFGDAMRWKYLLGLRSRCCSHQTNQLIANRCSFTHKRPGRIDAWRSLLFQNSTCEMCG